MCTRKQVAHCGGAKCYCVWQCCTTTLSLCCSQYLTTHPYTSYFSSLARLHCNSLLSDMYISIIVVQNLMHDLAIQGFVEGYYFYCPYPDSCLYNLLLVVLSYYIHNTVHQAIRLCAHDQDFTRSFFMRKLIHRPMRYRSWPTTKYLYNW